MAGQPVPADLQPLPPPPPYNASEDVGAPAAVIADKPNPSNGTNGDLDEPKVTITKQSDLKIEEYRVGGRLYMIKVTPKKGPPYYLVDDRGDGKFARQESLDSGFRPPQWVIKRF